MTDFSITTLNKLQQITTKYYEKGGCFGGIYSFLFRNNLRRSQLELLDSVIKEYSSLGNEEHVKIIKGALLVVLLQIQDDQKAYTASHSELRKIVVESLQSLDLTLSQNIKTKIYSIQEKDKEKAKGFIETFRNNISDDTWKNVTIPSLLRKYFPLCSGNHYSNK